MVISPLFNRDNGATNLFFVSRLAHKSNHLFMKLGPTIKMRCILSTLNSVANAHSVIHQLQWSNLVKKNELLRGSTSFAQRMAVVKDQASRDVEGRRKPQNEWNSF